jgi:hypothetical protein
LDALDVWTKLVAEFIRVNTDMVRSSGIELGRTENTLTARVFTGEFLLSASNMTVLIDHFQGGYQMDTDHLVF